YTYELTDVGRAFLGGLVNSDSIDSFIENDLVGSFRQATGIPCPARVPERTLSNVAAAYSRLQTGLGYCSLRETAALAAATALESGDVYFEIADADRVIQDAAQQYGRKVRLTQSRTGGLSLFRMEPALAETLSAR